MELISGDVRAFGAEAEAVRRLLAQIEAEEEQSTARVLTDAEGTRMVELVSQIIRLGALLDRWDLAIAAYAGPRSSMAEARAGDIAWRVDHLKHFAATRARLGGAGRDRLSRWDWDDRLNDLLTRSIAESEKIVRAIVAGQLREISRAECMVECLRVVPAIFGTLEETPNEVVDFCERHAITEEFLTASKIVKDTFPESTHLRTEVVDDPEGDASWVTLRVRVPKNAAHQYYRECVARLASELPLQARAKLRVRPDLAA